MAGVEGHEADRVEALHEQGDRVARPASRLPGGVREPRAVRDGEQLLGAGHPIRAVAGGAGDPFQFGPLRLCEGAQGMFLLVGHGAASRLARCPERLGQHSGSHPLRQMSWQVTHYEYLEPVFDVEGGVVQGITFGALLYVVSHRALGVLYPTFAEPLRDQLCDVRRQPALIDDRGCLKLEPLIAAHSRCVASLTHQRKVEPLALAWEDRPDYGDYTDEQTTGSWLDDFHADESEDEERSQPEWRVAHRRHRP
jgi:hypothetical protein